MLKIFGRNCQVDYDLTTGIPVGNLNDYIAVLKCQCYTTLFSSSLVLQEEAISLQVFSMLFQFLDVKPEFSTQTRMGTLLANIRLG